MFVVAPSGASIPQREHWNGRRVCVYDGNLLVGAAPLETNAEVTPVVAWRAAPDQGLPGFTEGNEIIVRLEDGEGKVLATNSQRENSRTTARPGYQDPAQQVVQSAPNRLCVPAPEIASLRSQRQMDRAKQSRNGDWKPGLLSYTAGNVRNETEGIVCFGYGAYAKITLDADEKTTTSLPTLFLLQTPYPNPFNSTVTFSFEIPAETRAAINIYNVIGQQIENFDNRIFSPGIHQLQWNGADHPTGMYFVQLRGDNGAIYTQKMILIR